MDSFELSKIAGAVLAALLVIVGSKAVIELRQHGVHIEKAGFKLSAPTAKAVAPAAGEAAAPAAGKFEFAKIAELLAAAKSENGQGTFKKCANCHSAGKGAPNKVGPNLWGIVGRKAGTVEGFGYTDAMKGAGEWSFEHLAAFVHNPKGTVQGTKMVFAGVPEAADIADLLAYLRTLSDSPAPLPK